MSSPYVPALDGVRAVAVLLVVLFHLRVPGFAAGFLGVDMFFVLSGFLITSLALDEIDRTSTVSLTAFWARRIRRLLPALVMLLVVIAAVTWLTAGFSERADMRGDLVATTTYVGNWHFVETSSYFNSTGRESPLEHTWSLAIEEQFYLVWPVAIVILGSLVGWRRSGTSIALIAGAGVIVSASLLAVFWDASAVERAYMGTDSRVFEPLIGALGAMLVTSPECRRPLARGGTWLPAIGAIGVAVALVLIEPEDATYYRGGALWVSVMTVALVAGLWTGRGGWLRTSLAWRPVAWVGAISYGIYLWHWPVAMWLGAREPSPSFRELRTLAAVALTVGLAAVSFYLVERPFRAHSPGRYARGDGRSRIRWVLATGPVSLAAVAALALAATDVPPPARHQPVVMLAGDSVPHHLEVTLEERAALRGWRVASAAHGSCPVTGETVSYRDGTPVRDADICSDQIVAEQDALIAEIDPDLVVWWDRWSVSSFLTDEGHLAVSGSPRFWRERRETLHRAFARLTRRGATVVFVAVEPPGKMISARCDEQRCNEWLAFQVERYDDVTVRWNELLHAFAARHPRSAAFISITDIVCADDSVPCDDSFRGTAARPDGTHYQGAGADLAAESLVGMLEPAMDASIDVTTSAA
jgi:peptidoglycan/LPS O-acetylase OafA/YrhL